MPAVVRGGRRQSSNQAPRKSAPRKGAPRRGGSRNAPRNASGTPGKMAALGRLDLSPRAVIISFVAGVVLVGAVLFTGARADRIGASVSNGVNSQLAGMGLALNRVHVTGASDEARPAIQRAIRLTAGQPITGVDLDAVRADVEAVGWVKSARVVRLLGNPQSRLENVGRQIGRKHVPRPARRVFGLIVIEALGGGDVGHGQGAGAGLFPKNRHRQFVAADEGLDHDLLAIGPARLAHLGDGTVRALAHQIDADR